MSDLPPPKLPPPDPDDFPPPDPDDIVTTPARPGAWSRFKGQPRWQRWTAYGGVAFVLLVLLGLVVPKQDSKPDRVATPAASITPTPTSAAPTVPSTVPPSTAPATTAP